MGIINDLGSISSEFKMEIQELPTFGIVDYVLLAAILVISLLIGVWMHLKGNKTPEEYLMGNRAMKPIPVAMSLLSSFVSAINILGYAAEIYVYGTQICLLVVGAMFGIISSSFLTLPVIHPLRLTSVNEYMELRFKSPSLRVFATFFIHIQALVFLGICLYAPSIALASVTPLDTVTYIFLLGGICTIYSAIGGIRAVVWTDVFQLTVMIIGLLAIVLLGVYQLGGFGEMWSIANTGGRMEFFNMNPSIYQRHNFYNTIAYGFFIYAGTYGVSQVNMQRVCSVSSIEDAKTVLYLNAIGIVLLHILMFMGGMVVYGIYSDCDPVIIGKIKKNEEILTLFVTEHLGYITGLPGIFVATLLGGALSSMSSVMNAQVALQWKDVFLKIFKEPSAKTAMIVNKVITLVIGLGSIGMALLTSKAGNLIQFSLTVMGVTFGPIYGVFLVGMYFPKCNYKGAWSGFLLSWFFLCWIAVGASVNVKAPPSLPRSTDGCTSTNSSDGALLYHLIDSLTNMEISKSNHTEINQIETGIKIPPLMALYGISYTLYPVIGPILCIVIALLVSSLTGNQDLKEVSQEYISPYVRKFYWPNKVCWYAGKDEPSRLQKRPFIFCGKMDDRRSSRMGNAT